MQKEEYDKLVSEESEFNTYITQIEMANSVEEPVILGE